MNIINKSIIELIPYENNPRKNDESVPYVAESIKTFGFKVPIVIDRNNVIVCGHTRFKAAKQIGMMEVPCIVADDLSDEQIAAFRLADNKVGEASIWDDDLLSVELADIVNIDMSEFGFAIEDNDEPSSDELEEEIENRQKSPVAVRIVFKDAEHFRRYEDGLRQYVDGLADVGIVVGEYIED